jgi:hypothetical protein
MSIKFLYEEIEIKTNLIALLNNIIIQQQDQIDYYRNILNLLQENISIIKKILDDD